MATKRPRYTVSVDDELFGRIEDFRYENRFQTRSDATVELIRLGLEAVQQQKDRTEKAAIETQKPAVVWQVPTSVAAMTSVEKVPVQKIGRIAAGLPIEAIENPDDFFMVPKTWRADAILEVVGDSMEPRFPHGCHIAIRYNEEPQIGNLVVAQRFTENSGHVDATFKRLRYANGSVVLEAINEAYDDIIWPRRETAFFGEVVGIVPDSDEEDT